MRIVKIETFANPYAGFVRVTDAEGRQGWGQVSTYQSDITAQVLHRQVAPTVLGADCTDLDALLDLVGEREHKFPGSYLRRAMGGVDTAVWDLRGRIAGKPVVALLGGTPGKVRAYASSMKRDITPEDEAARMVRLKAEHGFAAFKVRVGAEYGHDRDQWPGRTEALIPAIRRALGPEAELLVDANSGFGVERAIEVGRMLEGEGYCHYEEPCLYWELEQTKEVADALKIDVCGGEQDCDLTRWRRMIEMRAVDVVQPDVCYVGGIGRALRVCRMAEAAGLPVTPHCANWSMVTLFTMHLLRAIPNPGKYVEFSIEGSDYYPWQDGLFVESPYRIEDGHATVTDAPGWGVDIDPEWLAKSEYRVSEVA